VAMAWMYLLRVKADGMRWQLYAGFPPSEAPAS
jgi:hypothetical protein